MFGENKLHLYMHNDNVWPWHNNREHARLLHVICNYALSKVHHLQLITTLICLPIKVFDTYVY